MSFFSRPRRGKDLYKILDVSRDASDKEIKSAFLQLARKYHPDMNKSENAEKLFAEINEAYETLSKPEKREIYDSTGMSSNDQQNYEQAGGSFEFTNPFSFMGSQKQS